MVILGKTLTPNGIRFKSTFSKFREWYKSMWSPKYNHPPYNHVCQIGDPVLRQKAALVDLEELKSEKIQKVIQCMRHVMLQYQAIGIAAPQIGIPLRIIMIEFSESSKKHISPEMCANREITTIPLKVFINPEMKVRNYSKILFPESCESIKGLSAAVPRYKEVSIKGYDATGAMTEWIATGWAARIVQHEMDHLDGCLYTDIMVSKSLQVDDWHRINARQGHFQMYYKQK